MCSCHSILECRVTFSGVKLSIRSFVLLLEVVLCSMSVNRVLYINIEPIIVNSGASANKFRGWLASQKYMMEPKF